MKYVVEIPLSYEATNTLYVYASETSRVPISVIEDAVYKAVCEVMTHAYTVAAEKKARDYCKNAIVKVSLGNDEEGEPVGA